MNKHSKAYNLAVKYYPTLWNKKALQKLVDANKLYDWEYEEIVTKEEETKEDE